MGGSATEPSTVPDAVRQVPGPSPGLVRASDAERDAAVDQLKEQFVAGRLSHETFLHRIQAALSARHRDELPPLVNDLPRRPQPARLIARLRAAGNEMVVSVRDAARDARQTVARAARRPGRNAGRPYLGYQAAGPPRSLAFLAFPPGDATGFTIGRDQECDMFIGDMTVSRMHARLERESGGWRLTDLGSTNGTRVNGWRVRDPVRVRPGDWVRFGLADFVLGACDQDTPGEPSSGQPG
jgi:hypothetical protein